MKKYDVIANTNLSQVILLVEGYINKGWSLQGGITAFVHEEHGTVYAQAIVKY